MLIYWLTFPNYWNLWTNRLSGSKILKSKIWNEGLPVKGIMDAPVHIESHVGSAAGSELSRSVFFLLQRLGRVRSRENGGNGDDGGCCLCCCCCCCCLCVPGRVVMMAMLKQGEGSAPGQGLHNKWQTKEMVGRLEKKQKTRGEIKVWSQGLMEDLRRSFFKTRSL